MLDDTKALYREEMGNYFRNTLYNAIQISCKANVHFLCFSRELNENLTSGFRGLCSQTNHGASLKVHSW